MHTVRKRLLQDIFRKPALDSITVLPGDGPLVCHFGSHIAVPSCSAVGVSLCKFPLFKGIAIIGGEYRNYR